MREELIYHRTRAGNSDAPGAFTVPRHDRGDRSPDSPALRKARRAAGERGAPCASRPARFRLDATLAHVRGNPETHAREEALPWHMLFEQQEQRLAQHARERGLPTDWQPPADASALPGGAEHHLWRGKDGRMYKMTKDDHFGQVPCYNPTSETGWENFAAAPVDYLERLRLMNEVFGDDLRLVALRCGHTVSIVTSQPLRRPADKRRPHPRSARKIEAFMEQRGFVNLGFSAWYHPVATLMVTDATLDNFIETRKGLIPVDLMICRAEGKLRQVLEKKIASGQPNDEVRLRARVK